MSPNEIEQIAESVALKLQTGGCKVCHFPEDQRENIHAFAKGSNPDSAAYIAKIGGILERTSYKLTQIIIWMIIIVALFCLGLLGFSKLLALLSKG